MVAVDRIPQEKPYNFQGQDKRKDAAQGVAAGVGATGAISYQAKRAATKNGLRSVFTKVNNGSKVVRENAGEISSLYNKFTKDIQRFSKKHNLIVKFSRKLLFDQTLANQLRILLRTSSCIFFSKREKNICTFFKDLLRSRGCLSLEY